MGFTKPDCNPDCTLTVPWLYPDCALTVTGKQWGHTLVWWWFFLFSSPCPFFETPPVLLLVVLTRFVLLLVDKRCQPRTETITIMTLVGARFFVLFWKSRSETGQKLWIVSLWNSKIALDPVRYPCLHMCSTYRKQCFFIFIFMHHCGAFGKKCTHTEEMVMWTEPLNLSGCEWRALAQEPPKTLQSKSNRTERE